MQARNPKPQYAEDLVPGLCGEVAEKTCKRESLSSYGSGRIPKP